MPTVVESFPLSSPRIQQLQVMEWLDREWDNRRFFLIDAPTGVGKSAIAMAVARRAERAFFLTSTKVLQDQYMDMFGDELANLKGKDNYLCNLNKSFKVSHAVCLADKEQKKRCLSGSGCSYYNARDLAIHGSNFMITSYAYYLMAVECGPLRDRGDPGLKRGAIICDEAHELDAILSDFLGFEINCANLMRDHEIDMYPLFAEISKAKEYAGATIMCARLIRDKIWPTLCAYESNLERMLRLAVETAGGHAKNIPEATARKIKDLSIKRDKLDRIYKKMQRFSELRAGTANEWLITPVPADKKILFSPLVGRVGFLDYIGCHSDKVILMSASLGDPGPLMRDLGIPEDQAAYISVGTPFDPEKSPVYSIPDLKLSHRDIESSLPSVTEAVQGIMDLHPNEKGIIHAGNYKLTAHILESLSAKHKKRLIGKASGKGDSNERLIQMHSESNDPTVLVSPSMHTGVDLHGDLSRFQIIVKLPWASLVDPRIKKKSDDDDDWYSNEMIKKLIQACGRSTRNTDDHSVTYVLDSAFTRVYRENRRQMPGWFLERIKFV